MLYTGQLVSLIIKAGFTCQINKTFKQFKINFYFAENTKDSYLILKCLVISNVM